MVSRRKFLKQFSIGLAGLFYSACNSISLTNAEYEKEPTQHTPGQTSENNAATNFSDEFFQVLASGLDFPESPAFDSRGSLWCTEMGTGNIIHWEEDRITRFPCHGIPNSITFDRFDQAWVCDSLNNSIRRFDPVNERWETIINQVQNEELQAPNDLIFDNSGNLLFTCPNYIDTLNTGYICCLSADGVVKKITQQMHRPNGIAIIEGGKYLVVADTYTKELYRGIWDGLNRTLIDFSPWIYIGGREGPDGIVYSSDGTLFCAVFGDGIIKALDKAGNIITMYKLPGSNPTNAALDPNGKLGLVVTEAENGLLLSFPNIKNPSS